MVNRFVIYAAISVLKYSFILSSRILLSGHTFRILCLKFDYNFQNGKYDKDFE